MLRILPRVGQVRHDGDDTLRAHLPQKVHGDLRFYEHLVRVRVHGLHVHDRFPDFRRYHVSLPVGESLHLRKMSLSPKQLRDIQRHSRQARSGHDVQSHNIY